VASTEKVAASDKLTGLKPGATYTVTAKAVNGGSKASGTAL
jgi:hypothetical protein